MRVAIVTSEFRGFKVENLNYRYRKQKGALEVSTCDVIVAKQSMSKGVRPSCVGSSVAAD